MMFGLSDRTLKMTVEAISQFTSINRASIFGSRAMGNYKRGSDIDIVIWGENITFALVDELHTMLNEKLPIPYYYDVICYDLTDNEAIKSHIDEFGKEIFNRINTD